MNKLTMFLLLTIGIASFPVAAMNEKVQTRRSVRQQGIKNPVSRLQERRVQRNQEAQEEVVERRQSFVDTLRKYRVAMAAAATAAIAGVVASTSQVIDCAQVAQAVCNNQVVTQTALQVCSAHIPSTLSCWLGNF